MGLQSGFALVLCLLFREEGLPIGAENRLDEAFDLRQRASGRWRGGYFISSDEGDAACEAVNDGSGRDRICPQEFQKRQWLDAHLVNTAVDVAAVQQAEKGR